MKLLFDENLSFKLCKRLAVLAGPPPKVIWLRCGNQPTEFIEKLLRTHVEAIVAFEQDTAACLEIY